MASTFQEIYHDDAHPSGQSAASVTDTSHTSNGVSDAQLIGQVRSGQLDAYGQLFARHREAATRFASHLAPGPDADDLVAEGFSRVLTALQNGKGPDEFFRAYLLTSLRHLHVDRVRAAQRVKPTDDEAELDRAIAFVDPAEMKFEQHTAAAAFASLPERWRLVLWHLDVEGQKPAEVAPLLGISPNSVSKLAYRAREGLRTSYLQGHLAPPLDEVCRRITPQLASHVRNNLSKRDAAQVEEHLDSCARCSGLYAELAEINYHLPALLAPALLGTAAAGYLASPGSTAAIGLISQLADGIGRPFRWAASVSSAGVSSGALVTAFSALAIAAGAVAVTQLAGEDTPAAPRSAEPRSAVTSSPPAPPGAPELALPTTPQPAPAHTPFGATPPPTVALDPAEPRTTDPETGPTPGESAKPAPSPGPTPGPTVTPPRPELRPEPRPTATAYSTSVAFENEPSEYLTRKVTVTVTAAADVPRGNALTVAMTFSSPLGGVEYRGGSIGGWDCGSPIPGAELTAMSCTRAQNGSAIPPIAFGLHGRYPGVGVDIRATDNNAGSATGTTARACDYFNPSDCPAY